MRGMRLLALALVLSCGVVMAEESSPHERLPVPNSTAQTRVRNQIREQHRAEFSKRNAADQLALAHELQTEAAAAAHDDPNRQYVLLREAREAAVNAGDLDAAFSIIQDTSKAFLLDANELRVTSLTDTYDRALVPKIQLMDTYLKVATDALSHADVQLAFQSSRLATKIARESKDPATIQRAKVVDLRVHEARRQLTEAVAASNRLKVNPDNPDASTIVGRYLCFVQGQWDQGLPLLARGSDKPLRDLASADQSGPNDAAAMADLADRWWNLPDTARTPQAKSRQRAVHWYEQALPNLKGEQKAQATQRLAEVKAQAAPGSAAEDSSPN